MPRRRMIDPCFWDDIEVSKLTPNERLLVLSCLNNADDEGRMQAHPAFMKSKAFLYDKELTDEVVLDMRESILKKMDSWSKENLWVMVLYQSSGQEYIHFPNWLAQQKPSHPTKSKLPPPTPQSPKIPESLPNDSREAPESLPNDSRTSPPQSSLGQSSLGKVSLGKVRVVLEDFTKLTNKKDLTDRLMTTIKEYMPARPLWAMEAIKQFWIQRSAGEMSDGLYQVAYQALTLYPPDVLAEAFVKAVEYAPGKTNPAHYLQKILEEKAGKNGGKPP